MRKAKISEVIDNINSKYITEASFQNKSTKSTRFSMWPRVGVVAASFVLITTLAVGGILFIKNRNTPSQSVASTPFAEMDISYSLENPDTSTASKTPEDVSDVISESTDPINENSGDESYTPEESDIPPFACEGPEENVLTELRASNAAELAEKLKFLAERLEAPAEGISEQVKNECFSLLDDILAEEYVFNPSYNGNYAERDDSIVDPPIRMIFGVETPIVSYRFKRNAVIHIVYPNEHLKELIDKRGIEGYALYLNNDKEYGEDVPSKIKGFSYDTMSIETVYYDGKPYTAMKCIDSDSEDQIPTVFFIYDGKVIITSANFEDRNTDDLLKGLKLEKQSFDKDTTPVACVSPDVYDAFLGIKADNAENLAQKITYYNMIFGSERAKFYGENYKAWYYAIRDIAEEGYVLNPSCDGVYAEEKTNDPFRPIFMTFWPSLNMNISYEFNAIRDGKTMVIDVDITYPNQEMQDLINQQGLEGYQTHIYGEKRGEKVNITIDGKTYEAIKTTEGSINTVVFLYEGKVVSIKYYYFKNSGSNPDSILDLIKLEKIYLTPSEDPSDVVQEPIFEPYDVWTKRMNLDKTEKPEVDVDAIGYVQKVIIDGVTYLQFDEGTTKEQINEVIQKFVKSGKTIIRTEEGKYILTSEEEIRANRFKYDISKYIEADNPTGIYVPVEGIDFNIDVKSMIKNRSERILSIHKYAGQERCASRDSAFYIINNFCGDRDAFVGYESETVYNHDGTIRSIADQYKAEDYKVSYDPIKKREMSFERTAWFNREYQLLCASGLLYGSTARQVINSSNGPFHIKDYGSYLGRYAVRIVGEITNEGYSEHTGMYSYEFIFDIETQAVMSFIKYNENGDILSYWILTEFSTDDSIEVPLYQNVNKN